MNKFSKLTAGSVVATAAVLGGAGVASADVYEPRKVVYERPADWSGVYFGVHSGYQWSSLDQSFVNTGDSVTNDYTATVVGGHLGVQHQFGGVVLGVEGNLDSMFFEKDARAHSKLGINCGSTLYAVDVDCTHRLDDVVSVGGRIGYAAGKWLPYITGGYANARIETTRQTGIMNPTAVTPHVALDQDGERHDGWYLGGGVEWIVSPGWTMGIEYRHYEFNSANHLAFCTGASAGGVTCGAQGIPQPFDHSSVDASSDSITARVSWKFGREPAAAPLK